MSITAGFNRRKAMSIQPQSPNGALLRKLLRPFGALESERGLFPPVDTGGYRHFAPPGQQQHSAPFGAIYRRLQMENAPLIIRPLLEFMDNRQRIVAQETLLYVNRQIFQSFGKSLTLFHTDNFGHHRRGICQEQSVKLVF